MKITIQILQLVITAYVMGLAYTRPATHDAILGIMIAGSLLIIYMGKEIIKDWSNLWK